VSRGDFDLGLAFDGDGDRVLAVDAAGEVVDGDKILAILGTWLREQGRLANDTVVVTSMSNLGFHRAMAARAIHVEVTDVGDRYVLERMLEVSAVLGGEQSGHVILLEAGPTGDGLQTGLLLAQAVRASGRTLTELAAAVERFPQLLVNVRVGNRDRLKTTQEVWDAVADEQRALGDEGRIVLRPSGTEPLVRVMVEAPSAEVCREVADRLALTVERALS
jgi:phosphoglucosamine mutase